MGSSYASPDDSVVVQVKRVPAAQDSLCDFKMKFWREGDIGSAAEATTGPLRRSPGGGEDV